MKTMVGWTGASKDAPGSLLTGLLTPFSPPPKGISSSWWWDKAIN
nr:hypothetical protein [Yersinia pestis]